MASLVTKGNTIYVPAQELGGANGKKVTINWSQSMKSRTDEYYACKYVVKSGSGEGIIFVQVGKLEEFRAKKVDGEDLSIVVDDKFQYGQNKEKTKRFLVYHDKEHKPYQHRFIENMYTELGGKAAEFIASMGFKDISKVEDIAKHFLGDYLKDF